MDSKMKTDFSKLRRPRIPMPDWIKEALEERGLMKDYKDRPAYQQNDYLRWIEQAKMQETKQNRLSQMLKELEGGGVYMKMKHPASSRKGL
jgi:uncharacterized protein YdeI (YjbR/CyaY-like superfamily)